VIPGPVDAVDEQINGTGIIWQKVFLTWQSGFHRYLRVPERNPGVKSLVR